MGDFNTFLDAREKRGGNNHFLSSVNHCRSFINDMRLLNLGFIGPKFTWNNKRGGNNNIQERINRALCSHDWLKWYPNSMLLRLDDGGSDHRLILLNTSNDFPKPKAQFYFDVRWCGKLKVNQIIRDS
ncbi:hypothetical protein P3X46_020526 [Hevea brasiliensis]|uniref:Endonuclease/exonuclease/phosphatase domain-containing protein n=1 Tax=Hevea brasiliensis TaxID=3981 RepID=A0ABQ9LQX3_HEVBR|nr:hypothetical protein P3X46_020526 [Hevea brasiliensis]